MEQIQKNHNIRLIKADPTLNMAFGFGLVSKIDGEDYYDLHGDNATEPWIEKVAKEFMKTERQAQIMHSGKLVGQVLNAFPLTTSIAESLGIQTKMTGLLLGMEITDPQTMKMVRSGEISGFSMGGLIKREAVEA